MSIFPARILLATDGSEDAELAKMTAVDLANSTGSELHLVTIVRSPDPSHMAEASLSLNYDRLIGSMEGDARAALDEQVKSIEEAGGKVEEAHIRIGESRAQEIVSLGEEMGIGLIVVGSRGLGGMRRALLGSVSESVVRHAHCPVMVVRQ